MSLQDVRDILKAYPIAGIIIENGNENGNRGVLHIYVRGTHHEFTPYEGPTLHVRDINGMTGCETEIVEDDLQDLPETILEVLRSYELVGLHDNSQGSFKDMTFYIRGWHPELMDRTHEIKCISIRKNGHGLTGEETIIKYIGITPLATFTVNEQI